MGSNRGTTKKTCDALVASKFYARARYGFSAKFVGHTSWLHESKRNVPRFGAENHSAKSQSLPDMRSPPFSEKPSLHSSPSWLNSDNPLLLWVARHVRPLDHSDDEHHHHLFLLYGEEHNWRSTDRYSSVGFMLMFKGIVYLD